MRMNSSRQTGIKRGLKVIGCALLMMMGTPAVRSAPAHRIELPPGSRLRPSIIRPGIHPPRSRDSHLRLDPGSHTNHIEVDTVRFDEKRQRLP